MVSAPRSPFAAKPSTASAVFAALVNHLADDYELGARIAQAGYHRRAER